MPSRQLQCENLNLSIQAVPFEINLSKDKWLVKSVYRSLSRNSEYFLNELDKINDYFSVSYDNHVIIGDFNLEPSTGLSKSFMYSSALYKLINVDTCFNGKGTCIDLTLTNRRYFFKNTNTFQTSLSDHHHKVYTIRKYTFEKEEPIKLTYRDYKNFSFIRFKAHLENALKRCPNSHHCFEQCFSSKFNGYVPKDTKWVRRNNQLHMNKSPN